jgi:hypothetical protein
LINLTNHPDRKSSLKEDERFKNKINTFPLNFNDPLNLTKSLEGADTLLCTYWIRFDDYGGKNRSLAIQNVKTLVDCAKKAQVKKIIYTSHTNTSIDS